MLNSGIRTVRAGSVVAVAAMVMTFLVVGASSAHPEPALVSAVGCTIVGGPGPDVLEGTPGDDVICGRGGDDLLVARGGDDELRGGRGDDELSGGGGDDLARGEQGQDVVKGGPGDDRLRGGKGNDQMDGRDAAESSDFVRCGPGTADRAFADTGDDVVSGCEVVNQNDPPIGIEFGPATVAENSPVGTLVGTLTAKDPDAGDKHSFSLVSGPGSGDNGLFKIQGKRLLTAGVVDFEADASLSVRVRARDLEGARFATSLTVAVTDLAENAAPVAVDDARTTPEDTRTPSSCRRFQRPGGQRQRRRRRRADRDRRLGCRRRYGDDHRRHDHVRSDRRSLWRGCGTVRLHRLRRSRRLRLGPGHGRRHLCAGRPDRCRRRGDPRRGLRGGRGCGAGQRQRRRRRPAGHRLGHPAGPRDRDDHRGGVRADLRPRRGLLQRPGRGARRHVHLHADREYRQRDGVGHGDVRRRSGDTGGGRGNGARGQRCDGDQRVGQRPERRRWADHDRIGDPAGQRDGRRSPVAALGSPTSRTRTSAARPRTRSTTRSPWWADGDRVGDGDVCRRSADGGGRHSDGGGDSGPTAIDVLANDSTPTAGRSRSGP